MLCKDSLHCASQLKLNWHLSCPANIQVNENIYATTISVLAHVLWKKYEVSAQKLDIYSCPAGAS